MASQWRIRHKLMLGLGLVVGIMALLLGGTLRGLWSYYLTLNSIRSLLTELKAAQELKESVADVISRAEDPNNLLKKPREDRNHKREAPAAPGRAEALPEFPGEPAPHKEKPATLHDAITAARKKLDDYKHQLEEALNHGRDPINGEHALGTIDHLHKDFQELDKAVARAGAPRMGVVKPNVTLRGEDWEALQDQVDAIERGTDDLCSHIYDELHQRINESRSHYQGALWVLIPTSIVGLVLVFGLLCSFYAWVFYPIRDLALGVNRVARGDFDHRIELHSGDEMADLGAAFNDMMERLQELYRDLARQVNERSRQLVRSERLASVGFLAAGVAHEINNPLASIAFCSEALEARLAALLRQAQAGGRGDDAEVFARYLKMIQEEAFRCKNITERLLAFSRSSERRREETDLRELVQSVLDVTQHLQNHRGKHIDFEVCAERVPGGRITAWVNGEEIKSVVLNLVVNGLDSMDEGGRLTIRLAQKAGMAELQFSDTGCGMTQEVLENIFEPFFTRSRTGKGTGLGLTISHRIISQHGGEIEASSPGPSKGSTFTVRLPVQPAEPPVLPGPGAEETPAPRRPGLAA